MLRLDEEKKSVSHCSAQSSLADSRTTLMGSGVSHNEPASPIRKVGVGNALTVAQGLKVPVFAVQPACSYVGSGSKDFR